MLNLSQLTPAALLGIKLLVTVALSSYLVFSFIFLQKVRLLSRIVETDVSSLVVFLSLMNVFLTIGLLIAAVIVL